MKSFPFSTSASLLVITLALGLGAEVALAQEDESSSSGVVVEEVVVSGLRHSLEKSLEVKKQSSHVVEVLDLSDIDAIPDVTIAEALIRLPGVNGARDRGNQSQATIRGLGPRMVMGTVNGRETPSAEPGRAIRYEQYPSELISKVQIYKTQSADLISGGIAGTINLETVSPLEYSGPELTLRGGLVSYDGGSDIPEYDSLGNRFSGAFIKQISDTFGLAVGATSQLQKNAFPSFQVWDYNTGEWQDNMPDGGGDLDGNGTQGYLPWGFQTEVKKLDTQRKAIMGVAQFQPSDLIDIKYDVLYTEFDLEEQQNQTWYEGIGNWDNGQAGTFSDLTVVDGLVLAGTSTTGNVKHSIAAYDQKNSVLSHGLSGQFNNLENWIIDADLSYQKAERENGWSPVLLSQWWQTYSFDFRGVPSVTAVDGSGPAAPATAALTVDSQGGEYADLEDEITALQLDFNRDISSGDLASIDFGMRISDRAKEVRWWEYNLADASGTAWTDPVFTEGMLSSYSVGAFTATPFLNADSYQALGTFVYGEIDDTGETYVQNYRDFATERAWSYWKVTEDTSAAYIKANLEGDLGGIDYSANFGVRYESLALKSYDITGNFVDNDSSEVLPSATFNFFLSEDRILRVGAARAISRPPLDELRAGAYLDVNSGAGNGGTGNPTLKPLSSTQLDIAYEWYFAPESLLAVAIYHKEIDNYIGIDSVAVLNEESQTVTNIAIPANGDGGEIKGLELTFQMPIAAGFGVYSNYAYADSDIVEDSPDDNPYPLAGAADHTATIDLWFSQNKFEARLGWKYHSEYTTGFDWGGNLNGLEPEQNISLSLGYSFNDNLSVRLQGNNLTDEELRLSQLNNTNTLRRYDLYGSSYMVDVTWKL